MDNRQRIVDTVFSGVDFILPDNIALEYVKSDIDCVDVSCHGCRAVISYKTTSSLARGAFLLAMNISRGETDFDIKQHPVFEHCGVMIDCSRNGVIKKEAVFDYINRIASLGMNMLMLYTEDTYSLPDYPRFGYMRGRYSMQELAEIDEYGEMMGVEIVPCIQTLAHLSQFLKWNSPSSLRDTGDILIAGEEETYNFIEAEISAMRSVFHTNRIHIGMDEAFDVGRGNYLERHGLCDKGDILRKHLGRVISICEKYNFHPMLWDDMFVGLKHKSSVPRADMVYWDYYNPDTSHYDENFKIHKKIGAPVVFAGGIAIWYGFLPWFDFAYNNSTAAMKSCVKNNIGTVFATLWGDDGCETNCRLADSLLPVYSEYAYRGEECTEADIISVSEYLTKIKFDDAAAMGGINRATEHGTVMGKGLLYSDILYELGVPANAVAGLADEYAVLADKMRAAASKNDKSRQNYEYARCIYEILSEKCAMRGRIRAAYKAGNSAYLYRLADITLPGLKSLYSSLSAIHRSQWMSIYKPFGWEVLSFRYGGVIARIDDVIMTLHDYLSGKIECIQELEESYLPGVYTGSARGFISPSDIF